MICFVRGFAEVSVVGVCGRERVVGDESREVARFGVCWVLEFRARGAGGSEYIARFWAWGFRVWVRFLEGILF